MNAFKIIILSLLLISCNDELMVAKKIITINDFELKQFHSSSDLFENINLIPLEMSDSCIIGNPTKIIIEHDHFYIMDNNDKSITIFLNNGKFYKKIKNKGLAYNEYINLVDFTVASNGDILILDNQKKAVFYYDSMGVFKNRLSIDFYADALELLNDSTLVFNGSGVGPRVVVWDIVHQKVLKEYLEYDKRLSSRVLRPLIKYNGNIYFKQDFVSSVYKVTSDSLSIEYYIDFEKRNLNINNLIRSDYGFYVPPINYATANLFFESDNYILFNFECEELNNLPYYVYYSKKTGIKKVVNYDYYKDNIIFNKYPPMFFNNIDKDEFVDLIMPHSIINNHLSCDTSQMNDAELKRWKVMDIMLKNIPLFGNPIVAIYKLKDF